MRALYTNTNGCATFAYHLQTNTGRGGCTAQEQCISAVAPPPCTDFTRSRAYAQCGHALFVRAKAKAALMHHHLSVKASSHCPLQVTKVERRTSPVRIEGGDWCARYKYMVLSAVVAQSRQW